MTTWGKTNTANDSPFFASRQLKVTANTANRTALFGNTTTYNSVVQANSNNIASLNVDSKGWILKRLGTGGIASISITSGGTGYGNTNLLNMIPTIATGGVNATASIGTNGSGTITSITITNPGKGFTVKNPTVSTTNATGGSVGIGTGATLVATAGGKAGRTKSEVLVALGSA